MPATMVLTDGTQVGPVTLYYKTGNLYSVFLDGGEHRLIEIADVAEIKKVCEPRKMTLHDLPTVGRMWSEDGYDLEA